MLTAGELERFRQHTLLEEIGVDAQLKRYKRRDYFLIPSKEGVLNNNVLPLADSHNYLKYNSLFSIRLKWDKLMA